MVTAFDVLGYLGLAFCVLITMWAVWKLRSLARPGFLLPLCGGASVTVFAFITVWLLPKDNSSTSDDLRTAGLAAAAVLALYGLWLNDRRRRTEEERAATEQQRLRQERERTAGERFARAIELLGDADEAVKVGGMHELASLARGWPDLVQPTLDVLCAYLCMPAPDATTTGSAARVRQVRLTAQRIVRDVLRAVDGQACDLHLAGAVLDSFDLTGVTVDAVDLIGARCDRSTDLSGVQAAKLVLTKAVFTGPLTAADCHIGALQMTDTRFDGRVNLTGTRINESVAYRVTFKQSVSAVRLHCQEALAWEMQCDGPVDFSNAWFDGGLRLRGSTCRGRLTLSAAYLGPGSDLDDVTLADANLDIANQPDVDPQRLITTASGGQVVLAGWLMLVRHGTDAEARILRRRDNRVPPHRMP